MLIFRSYEGHKSFKKITGTWTYSYLCLGTLALSEASCNSGIHED